MAGTELGKKREWRLVGAVLAAGFALRMFFLLLPVSLDDDTAVYSELARNWFHHGIYGFLDGTTIEPTLIRLPGYPFFLGVMFAIFGQDHLRPAMVMQALIDLAGCWLLFDCVRSEVGRRAGWAALLLAIFCPFTAAYTAAGMTESLSVSCIMLAIWSLTRLLRAQRTGGKMLIPLLGLSLALGYAMTLRADGVLLTAAFCAGLVWYGRGAVGTGRALRVAVAAGLLAMVPLIPWAVRNYRTFHVVQPLAPRYANNPGEFVETGFFRWMRTWSVDFVDAGTVFWNMQDEIDPEDVPARACYTAAECRQMQELIAEHNAVKDVPPPLDAKFAALAAQRIRERPWNYYVVFPALRVADMWTRPRTELFDMDVRWWHFREHPAQSTLALAMGLVNLGYIVLAVAGFVKRRVPVKLVLLGYLALRCALLGTMENPEQRYTMVGFPILIVAGACVFARNGSGPDKTDRQGRQATEPVAVS